MDSEFLRSAGASLIGALIGSVVGPSLTIFLQSWARRRDSLRGALGELKTSEKLVRNWRSRLSMQTEAEKRRDDAIHLIGQQLSDGTRFDMSAWSLDSMEAAKDAFAVSAGLRNEIFRRQTTHDEWIRTLDGTIEEDFIGEILDGRQRVVEGIAGIYEARARVAIDAISKELENVETWKF